MPIPKSFLNLANHPDPGLHFPEHDGAKLPARLVPAPHAFGEPASKSLLAKLDSLMSAVPEAAAQFREFHARWDGVGFCCMNQMGDKVPAMMLLPIGEWEEATAELATGELAFVLDGIEEVLPRDKFIVVGFAPSEGTRLLLALDGRFEDQPLAGRICYASMDPVLAIGEPVADGLFDLLEQFARDPAAFLERIGATSIAESPEGIFGDVADGYVADCGRGDDGDEDAD